MTNNTPFSILNIYSKESYQLYNALRAFTKYPSIEQDTYKDIDGKLYSIAFVYLMQDFLVTSADMYPYEDWEELVLQMELDKDKEQLLKQHPYKDNSDFNKHIWALKEEYKETIIRDIKKLYTSQKLIISFFSSVYYLAEDASVPNANLGIIEFIEEL